MSKKGAARLRKCRRIGSDLLLTSGIRPIDTKCKLGTPPGMHGAKRTRLSDFGINLKEKQRFCITYGISNKNLYRYHEQAMRQMRTLRRKGQEADYKLLIFLESRLDNVVFRMGFASTRAEARQLVVHKAILVNGIRVNKPSYAVKPGDVIQVRDKSKGQSRITVALELYQQRPELDWIKVSLEDKKGEMIRLPNRDELSPEFEDSRVIQFYSK
jgi:small subunit ribosomal protein S4